MRAGPVGLGSEAGVALHRDWAGLAAVKGSPVLLGPASGPSRGMPQLRGGPGGRPDLPFRRATNGRLTTGTDYGTPTF